MAKNEPPATVSYMRKDTNLFADGTWYISTPCPIHGLVDEEVTWEEAKTPHHAGLIADRRHEGCNLAADAENQRAFARAEIEAARGEVERADRLLAEATARHEGETAKFAAMREALRALSPPKNRGEEAQRMVDEASLDRQAAVADADMERYRRGPAESRKRLADITASNT